MLRISFFILFGIFYLSFTPELTFFCRKKKIFSEKIVTRDWGLYLYANSEFLYMIKNEIKLRNNEIIRDSTFYKGVWRYDGDTLFLYSDACFDKEIKYLRKGRFLYSLGSCIDSFYDRSIRRLKVLK